MKFKFKGLSPFEEDVTPNFMGEAEIPTVVREFETMENAIEYVAKNRGFMVTDDKKLAFVVRNIQQIN